MQYSRGTVTIGAVALAAALAGCGVPTGDDDTSSNPTTAGSGPVAHSATSSSEQTAGVPSSAAAHDRLEGTVVNFTAGDTVVEVTIDEDTAATRDFLSMLPMTLDFEDYAGMEKISYPPRGFDTTGNEGMAPKRGDLFSYVPWSNLGFFYETGSLGHDDDLVRLGTTDDIDEVMQLDGQLVTIDLNG